MAISVFNQTRGRDLATFFRAMKYRQSTIVLITAHYGAMIVIFASTRWCDTEERWAGNGDSYNFGCKPKTVIFYATGKDENFMNLDRNSGLGGKIRRSVLGLDVSLESGTFHEDVDTFDLPTSFPQCLGENVEVAHVEVVGVWPAPDPEDERSNIKVRKRNLDLKGSNADINDLLSQIF